MLVIGSSFRFMTTRCFILHRSISARCSSGRASETKDHMKQEEQLMNVQNYSSMTIQTNSSFKNQAGVVKKYLYKFFGYGDANIFALRRASIFHYQACTDKLNVPLFFETFKLPDTFFSFFLVTQLHVWMCQVRSMQEGPEGRTLRNEIMERMWQDLDVRISNLDVFTPKKRKEVIQDLLYHHQGAIFSYDEGLLGNDMILTGALWRTLFSKNPEIDPRLLELSVKYLRHQIKHLKSIDARTWCIDGKFDWAPFPPLFNYSKSSNKI